MAERKKEREEEREKERGACRRREKAEVKKWNECAVMEERKLD